VFNYFEASLINFWTENITILVLDLIFFFEKGHQKIDNVSSFHQRFTVRHLIYFILLWIRLIKWIFLYIFGEKIRIRFSRLLNHIKSSDQDQIKKKIDSKPELFERPSPSPSPRTCLKSESENFGLWKPFGLGPYMATGQLLGGPGDPKV
jgi:hypothetical protein